MRFSQLDGAALGVWGAGREIASLARQLGRRLPATRIAVAIFDGPPPPDAAELLGSPGVRIAAAGEAVGALAGCDLLVRSPGVSIHRPELRLLRERGMPVTTATALWLAERAGAGVLGVSGTKGKSTTAALACHLASASGLHVRLAGNIGVPALDLLDGEQGDLDVLELSSYQIADLEIGPEVVVMTNLYREHVDWHGSEQAYRADKLRLLELPGVRACVLSARDPVLGALRPTPQLHRFASRDGWDVQEGCVTHEGKVLLTVPELPLPGEHNALNLCAALAGLEACGVRVVPLAQSLAGFAPLPHRLQTIAVDEGVTWVDDSISTTPESALAALASFPDGELVLIGGGLDRGQDFTTLAAALAERRAALVAVPSNGPRLLAAAYAAGVPPQRAVLAQDMRDAVSLARGLLPAGGVALLSPAAPSYDNYRDFEARGDRFRADVLAGAGAPGA